MTDQPRTETADVHTPAPQKPSGEGPNQLGSPRPSEQARARAMQRTVLRKSLRRRRARLTREDSVWAWLGTFGLVGWTVIMPTLAGLAFGIFLDNRIDASVSFAITFLVVGVAVGVSMAWYWVRQESQGNGGT